MNLNNTAIVHSRINYSDGAWFAEMITMTGESYVHRTPFASEERARLVMALTELRAESATDLDPSEWMHCAWDAYRVPH